MRDVAIIGPGRVGTLLAVSVARAGFRLVAVAGGTPRTRETLARSVAGSRPCASPAEAARRADLVLLCVPDDALEAVATDLAVADAVGPNHHVVHVAGSRGCTPLHRVALTGARVAACHPAMTVPRGARDPELLVGVAWAVTASAPDRGWASDLVTGLGGDPHVVPEDTRALYHAGLALASNAVGAAVATARRLLLAARVDDPQAFLRPLIDASVANVLASGAAALTGPIVRGDVGTVAGHLEVIDRDTPELSEAYRALGRATLSPIRSTLDPSVAGVLQRLLDGGHDEQVD
jgi:predicted short-subunit dehydrogenase-like oxidoreductase (DUF2520 family)